MAARIILPDYGYVAESTNAQDPSELHGTLCGMLCMDGSLTRESWITRLAEEGIGYGDLTSSDPLHSLFSITRYQLSDEDYSFSLLLPDEEMEMHLRAESLGAWCEGFLSGLSLSGLHDKSRLSVEIQEFLADVSHIARVGFDGNDPDEEDEAAYTEIVEYLRMGVLLVNRELGALATDAVSIRLH